MLLKMSEGDGSPFGRGLLARFLSAAALSSSLTGCSSPGLHGAHPGPLVPPAAAPGQRTSVGRQVASRGRRPPHGPSVCISLI